MKLFFKKLNGIHLVYIIFLLLALNVFFLTKIQPQILNRVIGDIVPTLINKLSSKPACKDCNIILISVDTLGANHLPCYGYDRNTSPNLCKFGQDNIIAKNAFSNSSFTLPSHVSIFTGLYPMKHGVNIPNVDSLDKSIPLLPEVLKKNGYETYFCMTDTDPHLPIDTVYNRGIDKVYVTSELIHWDACIEKLIANNKKGVKTFLFLHTYHIHAPYIPQAAIQQSSFLTHKKITTLPETMDEYLMMKYDDEFFSFFISKLKNDIDGGYWGNKKYRYEVYLRKLQSMRSKKERSTFLDDEKNKELINEYLGAYYIDKTVSIQKQDVARLADLYDTTILEFDNYIGSFFTRIKNEGLWHNTVITVTSDHGEEFMEHENVVGHGANLHDTTTKIPLVMRIPGVTSKVINGLTESVDLFPTLIETVGIRDKIQFQGANIFNKMQKQYAMSDLIYPDFVMRSNRNMKWKLYVRGGGLVTPFALYDIQNDPQESKNLIYQAIPKIKDLLIPFTQ